MKTMKLTIVARRIDKEWEAALVVDGHLSRTLNSDKLEDVVLKGFLSLMTEHPDQTHIVIDTVVETPEV